MSDEFETAWKRLFGFSTTPELAAAKDELHLLYLNGGGERTVLRAEVERLKDDYYNACGTIAQMHAAAVGEVTGPKRGVVEDVADAVNEQATLVMQVLGECTELRAEVERLKLICDRDAEVANRMTIEAMHLRAEVDERKVDHDTIRNYLKSIGRDTHAERPIGAIIGECRVARREAMDENANLRAEVEILRRFECIPCKVNARTWKAMRAEIFSSKGRAGLTKQRALNIIDRHDPGGNDDETNS